MVLEEDESYLKHTHMYKQYLISKEKRKIYIEKHQEVTNRKLKCN